MERDDVRKKRIPGNYKGQKVQSAKRGNVEGRNRKAKEKIFRFQPLDFAPALSSGVNKSTLRRGKFVTVQTDALFTCFHGKYFLFSLSFHAFFGTDDFELWKEKKF